MSTCLIKSNGSGGPLRTFPAARRYGRPSVSISLYFATTSNPLMPAGGYRSVFLRRSPRQPRDLQATWRSHAPAMVPAIATVPTRSGRTGRAQQPQWGRKVPAWAWPRVRFRSEAGVHGRYRAGASRWPRTMDSLQWVQPLGAVGLWCGISWTGTSATPSATD